MFMSLIFSLVSFVSCVLAVPIPVRDVVSPPITSPTAGAVWHVGETQTVTWSTANLPVNITNPNGMLVLGYLSNNSENLMLDSPLATNINYTVGQVEITVPNVPTRDDYIVVLFGDSGNASPEFTIINDASGTTTSPPTAATTTTTPASSASTGASESIPASSPGTSQDLSSGPSTTATTTTTLASASGSFFSTTTTITQTATSSPSTQTNAATWQFHPNSHYGLYLTLASLAFLL
ncbi:hypothetical protein ID866_4770 [Astraeus odoratus]|nr:hypothetical protein ID866_4770 [Astraeus odoratus]